MTARRARFCWRFASILIGFLQTVNAAEPAVQGVKPPGPSVSEAGKLLPLEVTVNGQKGGVWLLIERNGELYAPRDAFEEWRVRVDPNARHFIFRGEEYWALSGAAAYKSDVDLSKMALSLEFSPQAFAETRLGSDKASRPAPSRTVPALQFNYDVNYQHNEGKSTDSQDILGVLTEVALSSDFGVLTSSSVGRNLLNSSVGGDKGFVRLDTTFTRDLLDKNLTLRLGDSTTRAGLLGSGAYFGGFQLGTNFALAPGYATQPLQILSGSSLAPSTVNLYINDVLRQTSNIPTGPFAIDYFPTLSGSGEARMVIRDVLGRETIISQSYFTSGKLLAPGLSDWSLEAGGLRRNLGTESDSYGPLFSRGFWRYGYSPDLTLESSASVSPDLNNLNVGFQTPVFGTLLGSAMVAGSNDSSVGSGHQWLAALEAQSLRASAFLQAIGSSRNYRELGQDMSLLPLRQQVVANATYATENLGSFGVTYTETGFFDQRSLVTRGASYSQKVGARASLNVTYSRTSGEFSFSSLGFTLVMPLEKGPFLSAAFNKAHNDSDYYLSATSTPTVDNPVSWRLLDGQLQGQSRQEGGVGYFGRHGAVTADVSNTQGFFSTRLDASGGLVLAGGDVYATPNTSGSFVLAEIEGYSDVRVGLGSAYEARTNESGRALIPRLNPYQPNGIRIEANDVPISAELDSIEQAVVPAWRSVALAKFPVRSGRAAMIEVRLDDGQPAPAGATLRIEGDDKAEFLVARGGKAYVTGLKPQNKLNLEWKEQRCSFEIVLPPASPDDIPRLGPFACKGAKR